MIKKDTGSKFDDGKNRLDLIPPDATEGLGLVLTFGAKKYAPYNWLEGIKYSKIIAAIKRHLLAVERNEDIDSESGLLHVDHIACNIAFLQTYMRHGVYQEFDDRQHMTEKNEPTTMREALTTRAYMSHSIRGRKGLDATHREMVDNNNKAIKAGDVLRKDYSLLDVYVPGDHDEFIMAAYENGMLSEKQILDTDCAIIDSCDELIIYSEDGYLSRGMVVEIKYAIKCGKIVRWFSEMGVYNDSTFKSYYPDEWKKVC